MFRKCPHCGSREVRRSSFHSDGERAHYILRSPYRCEKCNERFWVISRKAEYLLAILIALIAFAIIAFLIPAELPQPPTPRERAPAVESG